jgi:hypothetical protein
MELPARPYTARRSPVKFALPNWIFCAWKTLRATPYAPLRRFAPPGSAVQTQFETFY